MLLKLMLKSRKIHYFMISLYLVCQTVYGQIDVVPASNTSTHTAPNASTVSTAASFVQVKKAVFSTPYAQLPNYSVHKKHFGNAGTGEHNKLLSAAKRTLHDPRDLIEFPQQQKLLQANGICFVGEWLIDQQASDLDQHAYTGLFSAGTRTTVITRASVALSGTKQKDKRAFGMAIKFFNPFSTTPPSPSLNAFILNSFGGVKTQHVLDLAMDNQPTLGSLPKWGDLSTALRLRKDLEKADRLQGAKKPQFSFRPVTHLAATSTTTQASYSPKWLRLTAITKTRVDHDDFRNELRVEHYPEQKIIYAIEVANSANNKKSAAHWQTIGQLILNQSITSAACDQRLHFMHPALN